jgi:hypothetical protein
MRWVGILLSFLLAGCGGNLSACWTCFGGGTEPPFEAALEPTFLRVDRGGEGVLRVRVVPQYPIRFALAVCLEKAEGGLPPPGIILAGLPPESCLVAGIEGEATLEVHLAVASGAAPGTYSLRLRVSNGSTVRLLGFTLEVG